MVIIRALDTVLRDILFDGYVIEDGKREDDWRGIGLLGSQYRQKQCTSDWLYKR